MSRATDVRGLPHLGSGLGYRVEIGAGLEERSARIDCVEVITERYAPPGPLFELERIGEHFQVIPHGVDLSIGSAMALDWEYLRGVKRVSDLTRCPYYSEHLCLTRAPGVRLGHLSPLWFTEDVLRHTIRNVREVQDYLEKPLVLENVTYQFEIPRRQMTQAEFFHRLCGETGCGILLDAHNVYTNSVNHRFDPREFLDSMPLEYVVQVHLAGGYWKEGRLVDGHCTVVPEETWSLFEYLVGRADVKAAILEHDMDFPEVDVLVDQVVRARQITARSGAPQPTGR